MKQSPRILPCHTMRAGWFRVVHGTHGPADVYGPDTEERARECAASNLETYEHVELYEARLRETWSRKVSISKRVEAKHEEPHEDQGRLLG